MKRLSFVFTSLSFPREDDERFPRHFLCPISYLLKTRHSFSAYISKFVYSLLVSNQTITTKIRRLGKQRLGSHLQGVFWF
jgi:hypothetical protein